MTPPECNPYDMTPLADNIAREVGKTVRGKASRLSVSIAVILMAGAVAGGVFIWSIRDTVLEWQRIASEAAHLRQAHEECQEHIRKLEDRIVKLEALLDASK